jgi:hypothetical protein
LDIGEGGAFVKILLKMSLYQIRHVFGSKFIRKILRQRLLSATLIARIFDELDVKRRWRQGQEARLSDLDHNGHTTAKESYLELTALLIKREIAKIRARRAVRVS